MKRQLQSMLAKTICVFFSAYVLFIAVKLVSFFLWFSCIQTDNSNLQKRVRKQAFSPLILCTFRVLNFKVPVLPYEFNPHKECSRGIMDYQDNKKNITRV